MEMAKVLISRMTAKWDPTRYKDDYKSAVMALIEEKIKAGWRRVADTHGQRQATRENHRSDGGSQAELERSG